MDVKDEFAIRVTQEFADPDLEARYRRWYFESTRGQFRRALLFGSALFLSFALLEFLFIQKRSVAGMDSLIWAARFIVIAIAFGIYVFTHHIRPTALLRAVQISWMIMFGTILLAFMVAAPEEASDFFYRFALLSLAGTVFFPFIFVHSAIWQLLVFLPACFISMLFLMASHEVAVFPVGPSFILVAVVVMGLYAKYYSERTLRANFVQSLQLERARLEAERGNEAKSLFLATASHELRTPLNGVLGNIRLIKLDGVAHPDFPERLDEVERSSLAMRNLIDDILNIARLEADSRDSAMTVFDLRGVLRDLLAVLHPLARSKDLDLEIPALDEPLYLHGNDGHLRQILLNLMGNAVKFTHAGRVSLTFVQDPGSIRFDVRDTGMGIPEGQLQAIFDEFTQAENIESGEMGGSGLGLSIVRRLVAKLGGDVAVESALGAGTTFSVTVPFAAAAPSDAGAPETSAASVGRRLNVLIVEDDYTSMKILVRFLEHDGHGVVSAFSGREAVKVFEPSSIDCILTDIRLPDIPGIQLLGELKEAAESAGVTHRIPAIAVTANVMPEDIEKYLQAGFDAVLSKPLDERRLFGVLKEVVAGPSAPQPPISRTGVDGKPDVRSRFEPQELVEIETAFRLSVEECRAGLVAARADGDVDRVVFLSHRLAGSAGSLGLDEMAALAREVEAQLSEEPRLGRSSLDRLVAACDRFLDAAENDPGCRQSADRSAARGV